MKKENWLVAVSGGPDSMALLHKFQSSHYELSVAHVNYHRREESDMEEQMVKDYCHKNGLSFYSVDFNEAVKGNFQAVAREFRYQFFAELIHQHNLKGVIVGHHYNDHLETYQMQKERGSIPKVMGLQEKTELFGIQVWRPLLNLSKDELVEYCEINHVPYSIDASNRDETYTRNRIRAALKNPQEVEKQLLEDQKQLSGVRYMVDLYMEELDGNIVDKEDYFKITEHLRYLYLRAKLLSYGVDGHHYKERFFAELDRQMQGDKLVYKFDVINIYVDKQRIVFAKPKPFSYTLNSLKMFKTEHFHLKENGTKIQGLTVSDDDFPITIRNVQAGDEILMRYGRKKVNRFLIDRKIPQYKRETWIVVENRVKECIFVVGMGCDVHHYSNNPSTYVVELNLL